jgi:hypothetical protein
MESTAGGSIGDSPSDTKMTSEYFAKQLIKNNGGTIAMIVPPWNLYENFL